MPSEEVDWSSIGHAFKEESTFQLLRGEPCCAKPRHSILERWYLSFATMKEEPKRKWRPKNSKTESSKYFDQILSINILQETEYFPISSLFWNKNRTPIWGLREDRGTFKILTISLIWIVSHGKPLVLSFPSHGLLWHSRGCGTNCKGLQQDSATLQFYNPGHIT